MPESWWPALRLDVEPMDEPKRLPSGDWRQDAAYPQPLWINQAAELAPRISIENLDGFYALQLLTDERDSELRAAEICAAAGWATRRSFHVSLAESARPIEDGFLRRVRVWYQGATPRAAAPPAQPVTVAELFTEFTRSERARIGDIEPWLRAHYGAKPAEHQLLDWIDYPVFDCGTMLLGYAILVHGAELHFWSRAAHAHK